MNPVVPQSKEHYIDKEKLKSLLPKGSNHKVTDEIISLIKRMEDDTGILQEYMEESVLSNFPVLSTIKVDLDDYVNAIKYCNLQQNMTNEKAWKIVFPERFKRLQDKGKEHSVSAHVSMYNKTEIVNKLKANMMVSAHIQYAPYFHASIKKQFELMNGASADGGPVSAHVQHLAAKELAELTKMPEDNTIELRIGQTEDAKESQDDMIKQMSDIAKQQRELLKQGYKLEDVQKINISIKSEDDVIDVEEE